MEPSKSSPSPTPSKQWEGTTINKAVPLGAIALEQTVRSSHQELEPGLRRAGLGLCSRFAA